MIFPIFILLLQLHSITDGANNNNLYLLKNNTDLLNKSASNNWLIESSNKKSKLICLARCNQMSSCVNLFFYQNQSSNSNCYLYSRMFNISELTISNFAEMYTTACPSGWLYFNQNCYKIFQFITMFWSAQAYCPQQLKTSYLADITSQDEFNWISDLVKTKSNYSVWVGVEFTYFDD